MKEADPSRASVVPAKSRLFLWLKRIALGMLLTPLALALLGFLFQSISTAVEQRSYPPPGQLVDVGGYRLHIYCAGEGSPAVILDAASMGTVSDWAWIQPELAASTRVCAYDRADSGWSDSSPEPNDPRANAEALHTLLSNAGIPGPYVLAGHSFGGLFTRMYAGMYPEEVAGMVFIEATLPDGLKALGQPDVMPNSPPVEMIDAGPFVSRLGLLRLMNFPPGDPDLPEHQRGSLQAFLSSTRWAEMIKRQYHLFPAMLEQVRPLYSPGSLGSIPVAVVLGSEGDGGVAEWHDLFLGQAALSTNNAMLVIDGANHASLVDRREHALQTSAAILSVVNAARTGQPLRASQ